MEERDQLFRGLAALDRQQFIKVAGAAAGAVAAGGLISPHSFSTINVANAQPSRPGGAGAFRIAYISDSHLYERNLNDRFVRSLLRAVDDVRLTTKGCTSSCSTVSSKRISGPHEVSRRCSECAPCSRRVRHPDHVCELRQPTD